MKKALFLLTLLFVCRSFSVDAQPMGNEWIHFENSYYKFKIGEEGIYRITKAELDALGISHISGNQFAVFREGQEIAIRTTTNGVFGNADYIEFYATIANGKMDTELYPNPEHQPSTDVNLLYDTAFYFLTYDSRPHKRYTEINNGIPPSPPVPAPYCWATANPTVNIRNRSRVGQSFSLSEYFYSSEFDLGEGYYYSPTNFTFNTYRPATASGATPTLQLVAGGQSIVSDKHNLTVSVGTNVLFDTAYTGYFDLIRKTMNVPLNLIGTSTTKIRVQDIATTSVYKFTLRYPRTFVFSNDFTNKANFDLPSNERYLEITSFNITGGVPDLYDLTNDVVYQGDLAGNTLRYYLNASSSQRKLFLFSPGTIKAVPSFETVVFRDYSSLGNQGNYIILSHKDYINASPAYLDDYKSYRQSVSGGSYQPVIVDVTELYDQFGYGFEYHALAIKRFIRYARAKWDIDPEYLFIVGKGIAYRAYRNYLTSADQYSYSPVPTWGDPGSDNLLSAFNNQVPTLATGRLSVWNNEEIGNYLEKVKAYESALRFSGVPNVADDYWKKKGLHIAGSSNQSLQASLLSALNTSKAIYEDTLIGGTVTTISKKTTDPVDNINNILIDSLINSGLNIITFYGHASSSGFDYNLNDPDQYQAKPRYPIFFAYGCDVANVFLLTQDKTVSEHYLQSATGGSIAMVAGDNFGYTHILPVYMNALYRSFSFQNYGKTLGKQYQFNIEGLLTSHPNNAMMANHTQSLLLLGDPALKIFNPEKPDYAIEAAGISTSPVNITTSLNFFELKAVVYNLGKTVSDSVWVKLEHTRQDNNKVIYTDSVLVRRLYNTDTLTFQVPINPNRDIGLNNYALKIDPYDLHEEISKQNNEAGIQVFIYSDNLVPVYPQEFSIVHQQDLTLKASTLDAFAAVKNYRIEIDTTAHFNSPLKQSTVITSGGGLVKWKPGINYQNNVVYYWRTTVDSLVNNETMWSNSSFIYLKDGSDGWNQSHYFQYQKDDFFGLRLDQHTREFAYTGVPNYLRVVNKVVSPGGSDYDNVRQLLNDVVLDKWGCGYTGAVQVTVFDSASGIPWRNTNEGLYGSLPKCNSADFRHVFEFLTGSAATRNQAMDFIKSIPSGNYVLIKNIIHGGPPGVAWDRQAIMEWMEDTLANGSGNSLYHAMKNLGFDRIDEFTSKKSFIFFGKKDDRSYSAHQVVASDSTETIELQATFLSYPDTGLISSTKIGPALKWESLKWESGWGMNEADSAFVKVFGLDRQNEETELYAGRATDLSLSFINAVQYPNLRLKWYSVDNASKKASQLKYWRVLYEPVPEAALNANAHFEFQDSIQQGQEGKLRLAIENLTPYDMDSMLVKFKIIDANSVSHDFVQRRYKPLPGNDTLIVELDFNADAYPGSNFLFVEANPDNDQPEQYHPNNLGYLPLFVRADKTNPLIDVTFDGVHILDKDIVSAKPFIKIQLKDENPYQALNDSSLISVKLLYPDASSPVEVPVDGTICKFIPAQISSGKKNIAYVEYRPTLLIDGVYKLIVEGKDQSGNVAGGMKYEVNFTIENKPSITNVLNYPNPFSTSTQFVFTLTGSEIPSQFKIQILTVTGKVVREITKNELGFLHIGRNITEYRWDGRDQFGQLLGNGVYLYRVITSIRGNDVEHRKNVAVDKYFKNGYGKLYIMR